jgi:hypothetical protein
MAQRQVHIAADKWFSTLDGAINSSVTEFDVADASLLPEIDAIRDAVIHCQVEKMRLIDVDGDTLTVERGYAGTTAASHDNGKPVAMFHVKEYFNDVAERTAAQERAVVAIFGDNGVFQDGGLQVEAEGTPSMTIVITAGSAVVSGQPVALHEDVEIEFTAPVSDPRIDTIQIDQFGSVTAKLGAEDSSPTAPAVDADCLLLATVVHTTAETSIKDADDSTNGYIVPAQVYL